MIGASGKSLELINHNTGIGAMRTTINPTTTFPEIAFVRPSVLMRGPLSNDLLKGPLPYKPRAAPEDEIRTITAEPPREEPLGPFSGSSRACGGRRGQVFHLHQGDVRPTQRSSYIAASQSQQPYLCSFAGLVGPIMQQTKGFLVGPCTGIARIAFPHRSHGKEIVCFVADRGTYTTTSFLRPRY